MHEAVEAGMNIHAEPSILLLLIPLLPLLGALVNGLFGKRYSHQTAHRIALSAVGGAAILSWLVVLSIPNVPESLGALRFQIAPWIQAGPLNVPLALWVDHLSGTMLLIITNVGFLIHLYSTGYMKGDPDYTRFFTYLNLFITSMLLLVMGENLAVLFIGWEGVGLCSYLLIGFWYQERENAVAGKKAFITNRIGDLGFLLGSFLLFQLFGTLSFNAPVLVNGQEVLGINAQLAAGVGVSPMMINVAALLLFVGCSGKSAQLPLYVWLPDAMAGPTPVSALIHAATMVTAGVYLIARLNGVYFHAEMAGTVVLWVGALTALFSASIGLVQHDIKKVLAYSTVSQLGFMFMAMGAGAWGIGMFHLMTHAFFKACLFLGSGAVIMAMHHSQDMRHYGGLRRFLPLTYITFLASTLAISGIPPFAGFFSKDEILWWSLASERGGFGPWLLGTAAAFCTAFYMFRIMYLTFWGEYRGLPKDWSHHHDEAQRPHFDPRMPDHGDHAHGDDHSHDGSDHAHGMDHGHDGHAHGHDDHHHDAAHFTPREPDWRVTVPLLVLGGLATVGGFLGISPVILETLGLGHHWNLLETWYEPIFAASQVGIRHEMHSTPIEFGLMGLSVVVALAAIGTADLLYRRNRAIPVLLVQRLPKLHQLLMDKWRVDEIYEAGIIKPILITSREFLWRIVDVVVIDGFVNGVGAAARMAGDRLARLQNGDVQVYAMWMLGGLGFLIAVILSVT